MNAPAFYRKLVHYFPFAPTPKQEVFFQLIAQFLTNTATDEIFVLKGFAGTGKTTLVSALVSALPEINGKSVLLAPTGRAAKVIANYAHKSAFTIHKKIYFPKKIAGGGLQFTLQQNKHKNTLFIVDEASMISDVSTDSKFSEGSSLLDDLISYVYSGAGCNLLLIGDTAQLPPVNMPISPALDLESLSLH